MAIYICPNCGQGVSTSEIHKCIPKSSTELKYDILIYNSKENKKS